MTTNDLSIPTALEPLLPVDRTHDHEQQNIWTGTGTYIVDGQRYSCRCELYRRWRPQPALVLTTVAAEPGTGAGFPNDVSELAPAGLLVEETHQVALTRTGSGTERRFLVFDVRMGDAMEEPVRSLQFAVPNFPRFLGQAVRRGGSVYAARMEVTAGDWHIRLEGTGEGSASYDRLEEVGYGITHLGTITKADGSNAYPDEIGLAMKHLQWWLSLWRGAYTAPAWWVGIGDEGHQPWSRHVDWRLDPWTGSWGVLPTSWAFAEHRNTLIALGKSLSNVFCLLAHEEWNEALNQILHLYLVANTGRSTSDILIAQAGLERMSHVALVLNGNLSGAAFDNLSAAQQIQRAMAMLQVDLRIPDELPHLKAWASAQNLPNLARAVTRVRNGITHSPRKALSATERQAIPHLGSEARNASLSLLEHGLLSMIGYDGYITDRLSGYALRPLVRTA